MMRTAIAILLAPGLLLAGAGCKGDKAAEADPRSKADLEVCEKSKLEKDKLITALQDEVERLQRKQGGGGGATEIVAVFEDSIVTVRAPRPGEPAPAVDPAKAAAASQEFLRVVTGSRGAIQKCYEQALKKDTRLQARTLTLTVSATFSREGAYRSASFTPSLGGAFDQCIQAVATKWKLPPDLPITSFRAPVSLTPS